MRKQGASPCLQLLGPVISEARAASIAQSSAIPSASNGSAQPASAAQAGADTQHHEVKELSSLQNGHGPATLQAEAQQHKMEDRGQPPPGDMQGDEMFITTAEHPAAEADMAAQDLELGLAVAGPAMPPGWAPGHDSDAADLDAELQAPTEEGALSGRAAVEAAVREGDADRAQPVNGAAEGESAASAAAARRPAAGPARPPPELLAAAAEVHQAVCHTVTIPVLVPRKSTVSATVHSSLSDYTIAPKLLKVNAASSTQSTVKQQHSQC